MDVQLDHRMMALGAALAAGSEDSERPESQLARETRRKLSGLASHPVVRWFREQMEKYELLTLAMQAEQLDGPPCFRPHAASHVPAFVDAYFSMVSRDELGRNLSEFWETAGLQGLFDSQRGRWQEVLDDTAAALQGVPVEEFQELFFGSFDRRLVVVPAANTPDVGAIAVGTANTREIRAVCCPYGADRYSEHAADLIIVVQHEASHVPVDDLQTRYPGVTEECLFVEEAYPNTGRFVRSYPDPGLRFVETLIRASTCFFLEYLGKEAAAREFCESQLAAGVRGIGVFVDALRVWWRDRVQGRCEGLDRLFRELPALLKDAAAR